MNAHRHLPWALVAVAMVLSGCTVRAASRVRYGASATVAVSAEVPQHVVVARPPPPLRAEAVISAQPSPDAVWRPGHYEWSGRWVWVPGGWERNRAGYVWVAPVAHQRDGQLVYYPGYWSPANRPPPPAYAQPGVAVSVVRVAPRPAPPPVVAARPAPAPPPARPAPPPARPAPPPARPAPPPARPAAPPRNPPTVVVRPAPAPTPPPAVTVRPAPAQRNPPTVVRPPAPATPAPGRVTVTPAPATPAPGRVTVTPTPANPPVVERRPVSPTRPVNPTVPGRVTVTPVPAPQQPSPPPTTTATIPRNPPAAQVGREPVRIVLTCRLDAPRAPMGGVVTLHGSGFQSNAQVIIGGTGAQIVSNRPNRIQVRVPGSSGGGQVRVVQGEASATCGALSISSR